MILTEIECSTTIQEQLSSIHCHVCLKFIQDDEKGMGSLSRMLPEQYLAEWTSALDFQPLYQAGPAKGMHAGIGCCSLLIVYVISQTCIHDFHALNFLWQPQCWTFFSNISRHILLNDHFVITGGKGTLSTLCTLEKHCSSVFLEPMNIILNMREASDCSEDLETYISGSPLLQRRVLCLLQPASLQDRAIKASERALVYLRAFQCLYRLHVPAM